MRGFFENGYQQGIFDSSWVGAARVIRNVSDKYVPIVSGTGAL